MRSYFFSITLTLALLSFQITLAQPCSGGGGSSTPTPTKCFEIVSILVDACDGGNEGQNEMVRLKIGAAPLLVSGFSVPTGGGGLVNWATAGNPWRGFAIYNATTLGKVLSINTSISNSGHCGVLIPLNPIQSVPANASLLIITSTAFNTTAQSFNNLMDTLYVVMQTSGNTGGHFANFGSGTRTLILNHTLCSDTVTYDRAKLLQQDQTLGAEDGGAVNFSYNGTDTYINNGCTIPIIPIIYDAGVAAGPYCSGSIVNLNGSVTGTNCYVWAAKDTSQGTFNDTTILTPQFTIKNGLGAGTITLYLKIKNSCASAKDSVSFVISNSSLIIDAGKDSTLCKGKNLSLNASSSGPGTITWTSSGLGSFTNNNTLNPTYTPNVADVGIYYLKMHVQTTCGAFFDSLKLTISNAPNPNFSFPTGTICEGSLPFNLIPFALGGIFSGNNMSGGNTFTPSVAGSIPIKYVVGNVGCADSSTKNIIVSARPDPIFTIAAVSICVGDAPIVLTPNVGGGIFSGSYIVGNTFNPSSGGTFPIKYLVQVATCADSFITNIIVNPKPLPTFSPSSNNVCVGSPIINLNPLVSGGIFSGSNLLSGNNFDPSIAGVFTIKYEVNVLGCIDSSNQLITVDPKPDAKFTIADTLMCTGDPATTFTPIELGGLFSGTRINGNSFNPTQAGTFKIQYLISKGSCKDSSVQTIKVLETPTASFSFNPEIGNVNEPIQFNYTGNAAKLFNWTFGVPSLGFSKLADPIFSFPSTGFYQVSLIVFNGNCVDSSTNNIEILGNDTLILPNVFTPNNDHINDSFKALALGIKEYNMSVYNRWGGLVFESNSLDLPWDGFYHSNPCPIGVYFYLVQAKSQTGREYNLHGTVTLLR
ncbi:MAG: gliding motility-associated C-terminal domain-containing protein [bacterium]|nr:gliding motility-associated C-terminal domain-containing protein [bacterium]